MKTLKKIVVASSFVVAAGAVYIASQTATSVAQTTELSSTNLLAANSLNRGRTAQRRPSATPVQLKDPFENPANGSLRKKSKTKSGSLNHKGRKAINPKEEFMPDLTDIPTASNAPIEAQPIHSQARWIKELSGKNARLQMAQQRQKVETCDSEHLQACADRGSDRSVTVAGVVVNTTSESNEALPQVQGEMARGGYAEQTPAVYVK